MSVDIMCPGWLFGVPGAAAVEPWDGPLGKVDDLLLFLLDFLYTVKAVEALTFLSDAQV